MEKRVRYSRPPTPESLAKAALAYLGRFAASELALRRVLENRIRRASLYNREFAQDSDAQKQLRHAIETIIDKHKKTGVLNDATYAETKINSLRRAGRSARAIAQRLGRAGVDRDVIAKALSEGDNDAGDTEVKAARELARRRKLGPFRSGGSDDAMRCQKDLAVLARAGFTLDIARQVLGNQCAGDRNDVDGFGDWSGG